MITESELAREFSTLGLTRGNHVVVHSALSRVGLVEGGPGTMLKALLRVLGPEGTVLVPAFSYCLSGRDEAEPFDAARTPGYLTGIFAETVRTQPGAVRSLHPTHSVAALGARAAEFTRGHEKTSALGINSPIHNAARAGARIVLVGVTHTANSAIHIGEVLSGVPYVRMPFRKAWGTTAIVAGENGTVRHVAVGPEFPGCSRGFDVIDKPLRERDLVTDGMVGKAHAMNIEAAGLLDTVCDLLRTRPAALLCDDPNCEACTRRRKLAVEPGTGSPMRASRHDGRETRNSQSPEC